MSRAPQLETIDREGESPVHRFNNLVTIVLGYCEMLLSRLEVDNPLRPLVRRIQSAGEQLLTLQGYLSESRETLPDFRPPPPAVSKPVTETILLVEDEIAIRQLAGSILRQAGYQVLEAADGDEAIQASRRHQGPIQLLLTDVVLPGMACRELCRLLRLAHPRIRIVYASGYDAAIGIQHGLEAGALFLAKPFSHDRLVGTVRESLDK